MSLGFSPTDFVTAGQICWKLYSACRGVVEEYIQMKDELLSARASLKACHMADIFRSLYTNFDIVAEERKKVSSIVAESLSR